MSNSCRFYYYLRKYIFGACPVMEQASDSVLIYQQHHVELSNRLNTRKNHMLYFFVRTSISALSFLLFLKIPRIGRYTHSTGNSHLCS